MATTHKLRVDPKYVIRTPSRKVIQRKLKTAETMGDFEMKPGYLYTVVRAISARVNQNYDGWPSEELKKAAHTFVGKPVFVNHENYDPTKARGVVVAARYVENGNDKYIEVIQEIDATRFPKLAHEIRTGGLDSVSMGAEAGFTICSYCGNKAYDVPDMCDHVLFHKGEKLSRLNRKTGKREEVLVYESCHKLSFFELSYVFDPADETAVASKVLVAANNGPSRGTMTGSTLSEPDPFDPRSYTVAVLQAYRTAAPCPPGQDCAPQAKEDQITPDSANNPLNQQGGGSSGSSSGSAKAIGGGDLGDPSSSTSSGGTPQPGDAKYLPSTKGLYEDLTKSLPGVEIGTYRVDDYHEHDHGAMDVMTSDPAQAETVKQKAFDAGAPYVLWQQTQWNADGTSSPMEDRGSPTQNHMDHVHTAPIAASLEKRVLIAAGYLKISDECHYCKSQAEEGFKSCAPHRPMEDKKFKSAVLAAMFDDGSEVSHMVSDAPVSSGIGGQDIPSLSGSEAIIPAGVGSRVSKKAMNFEADVISEFYGEPDPFTNMKVPGEHPMYGTWADPEADWGVPPDVAASAHGHTAADYGDFTPFRGREYTDGSRVRAYRNLHNGKWSVKALGGPDAGRILGHASELHLANPAFKVSEAGRQRVIRDKAKNVHAYVEGQMVAPPPGHESAPYEGITYNPYKYDSFVHRDTETPIAGADHVHLGADGKARAVNPVGFDGTPVSSRGFEARVLEAAGMFNKDHLDRMQQQRSQGDFYKDLGHVMNTGQMPPKSFEARVLKAWGETEAPARVDTLREEGSAPEDDNNDFYHYVEPPKELQAPDLSQAAQIDREQEQQSGLDVDGDPGPNSIMNQEAPGAAQPQQQYMELKIPIPQQGQAGAPAIPMQPYQDQPPAPQQLAASRLDYFDRYFGRRVSRINLQTLENRAAAFPTDRNSTEGTANMAPRNTLASRGKTVTAGRRQHFAEGPLVDTGDQSRNDQGEQEEVFITQTPPEEPVVAPTDDTPNISNTENNLVARVRRGREQLLRDAQALEAFRRRKTAGDQDEAGGPVATEVNPTVNTGPAGEELTGDDFESADPNADVVETQPKDASLHAFKQFDRWLANKTGKPCREHTAATIRRAAVDYSRAAGISQQVLAPALSIVLREARKNDKPNTKGAKMRKRADEKLEVAAPDGRIDVEAPTADTTDEEAQASQYDLHDFGNNAGDNLADPDLSTDQNWAPGEAKKSSKVKTAGGILAFRLAEAMIAAQLEPNTVERKYQLAAQYENANRAMVQSHIGLCEKFARILADERKKVASGSTRGANLRPPVPAGLTQGAQRTAAVRIAANDPRNDSDLFV